MWEYNHLCHYGVKGMKWGVRRSKEELDRLAGRAYKIEEHSDSIVIKKGSKLHRISASDSKDRKGYAYVSYKNEDVKGYRREISSWLRECESASKTYDLTMVAKKDIKVVGEVEKVKTFLDLVGNNNIDTMSIAISRRNWMNKDNTALVGKPAKIKDRLVKQGLDETIAEYYAVFSMNIFRDQKNKDIFVKALQNKGYDAMVDTEDAMAHRMQPLIVFERENTLKVTKITELPDPDTDVAWERIYKEAKDADNTTKKYHEEKGYDLV